MEPFVIRLDGEEIEASPHFDDLPAKPPKKKIRGQKSTTKKVRDYLIRKIQGLSLDELASFCLDKTWTKLIQHTNAAVKEFSMSFEPSQINFVASSFTTDIRQNIPGLVLTLSSICITLLRVIIGSKHRGICWGIFFGLALPANFTAESSLSTSLESLQWDVVRLMSCSDSSCRHHF